MTSQLDTCPACGHRSPAGLSCPRCGGSLRVDVFLEGPLEDEKTLFGAARDLCHLPAPPGSFGALKRALARPGGGVLGTGLSRPAARAVLEVLSRHGVVAQARPSAARPPRSLALPAAAGGLAAAAAGVLLWLHAGRAPGPPPPSAPPGPAPGAPVAAPAPTAAHAGRSLTTAEISSLASGAVAQVSCQGRSGTAFFVDPEHAATNGHVACGAGADVQVRLRDGRDLVGRTALWRSSPDLAIVEVPGAAAPQLGLGDSTSLAQGDPVVLIGNPHGLAFTAHEGKVSFVGRNVLGHAYVQVNADVNPGNSGGPLLDGRGRVVGIVSMKVTSADGIGLALPVEYLRSHLAGAPPAASGQQERWQAVLERVREEDRREVETYRTRYLKPALVAVAIGGRSELLGAVVRRWKGQPGPLLLTVEVRDGDRVPCSADGALEEWNRAEEALRKALRESPDEPRLAWAVERRIAEDLFVGVAALDLGRCDLEAVPAGAVLAIRGGEAADRPVAFPRAALAEARARQGAQDEAQRDLRRQQSRLEEQRSAQAEASWRQAFRQLRASVAELESRRDRLRARSSSYSLDREESAQLAEIEAKLARAEGDLEGLERQASLEGIPRAWRQ